MKKLCGLVILAMLFTGCASARVAVKDNVSFEKYEEIYLVEADPDPRNVTPKVEEKLTALGFKVILTGVDEGILGRQGTGFIITEDGYLLTAAHVLGKSKQATVWLNDQRYIADVIDIEHRFDEEDDGDDSGKNIQQLLDEAVNSKNNRSIFEFLKKKDLALLKLQTEGARTFQPIIVPKDIDYTLGEDVYTMGFPLAQILGKSLRLNKGMVSSVVGIKDDENSLQVTVDIQPGNSGGPLLNEEGQLVGLINETLGSLNMAVATGTVPQNINFAVKNSTIREFIDASSVAGEIRLKEKGAMSIAEAQKSVAKVHAGILPEDYHEKAKLACGVRYSSFWDMYHRFGFIEINFVDLDSQEVLLKAGQYGDSLRSENADLKRLFEKIEKELASLE